LSVRFLGEHWDYVVKPLEGALTLKGYDLTLDDFPIGAAAWLSLNRVRWRRSP